MGEAGGPVSRRTLLTGGEAGFVGLGVGGVAVRQAFLTSRDGPERVIPSNAPGKVVTGTFESEARLGASCGWGIAYSPGATRDLRVLVVLHGRAATTPGRSAATSGWTASSPPQSRTASLPTPSPASTVATPTGTGAPPGRTPAPW